MEEKPNTEITWKTSEFEVVERFNSKGLRGPNYAISKKSDEYRILILGDSFSEGYTVKFQELFSEKMKKELNNRGKGLFEVINSGTGGYSTDQELLFFQSEGKKYNPSLTVLMFYDNDVFYNSQPLYWRGHKPLFKLENSKLVLTNVPVPTPGTPKPNVLNSGKTEPPGKSPLQKIKGWVDANSYLYRLVNQKIRNIDFISTPALKIGLISRPGVPEESGVYKRNYTPNIRKAWEITEALLLKTKEEVISNGGEFLVFYIPSRASIYSEEWKSTKRKYDISDTNWNIHQVGVELERINKRNNIDFINPTKLFMAEKDLLEPHEKRLYFLQDGHWTVQGHRLTGKILSKFIVSNYLTARR